ncbi:MAG: hypothetical protein GX682_00340 [Clostridiaceae bacterium]|nr:hypothetical protein [Clostridiaceae bacterium]
MENTNIRAIIIALLLLVTGTVYLMYFYAKTMQIALDLQSISDNIKTYSLINEGNQYITDKIEEQIQIRQDEYYNSSDTYTKIFSNSSIGVRILLLIIFVVVTPVALVDMWSYIIKYMLSKLLKIKKKD